MSYTCFIQTENGTEFCQRKTKASPITTSHGKLGEQGFHKQREDKDGKNCK